MQLLFTRLLQLRNIKTGQMLFDFMLVQRLWHWRTAIHVPSLLPGLMTDCTHPGDYKDKYARTVRKRRVDYTRSQLH